MSNRTDTRKTLQVIATGRVAPYAAGERVEDIQMTKAAITAAIKAGHRVIDAEGNWYCIASGTVVIVPAS